MSTDVQLLEAWRAGDIKAGDHLFQRHFKSLYRFFATKVDGGVEDLIQRTLLTCVERRDHVRDDGKFRAYLFAVARNELYARLRGLKRERRNEDITELSVEDLCESAGTLVGKRREHRLLLRALRSLALGQQLLLELHYWEGMTMVELADVLDLPAGTVKSRLRTARLALGKAIEGMSSSPELLASTRDNLDRWVAEVRELTPTS